MRKSHFLFTSYNNDDSTNLLLSGFLMIVRICVSALVLIYLHFCLANVSHVILMERILMTNLCGEERHNQILGCSSVK